MKYLNGCLGSIENVAGLINQEYENIFDIKIRKPALLRAFMLEG